MIRCTWQSMVWRPPHGLLTAHSDLSGAHHREHHVTMREHAIATRTMQAKAKNVQLCGAVGCRTPYLRHAKSALYR